MNCVRLLNASHRNIFKLSSIQYATHPVKFLEAQSKWQEKDGVSKRWQLIYKAPMDTQLNYTTTYLTLSTVAVTAGGVYYAAMFDKSTLNEPVVVGTDVVIANSPTECLVYLGAFVAFHIMLKVLLNKYVLRLYQDGDNYIAVFRGHMFNTIFKHKFHLKEFKKLRPTIFVSWGDARFDLGNKHGIILENYFKTPEHFNYLLYKNQRHKPEDDDE
ncbi:uncharacterized protein LOC134661240 [Cydia amplana]|uniref:uncharacterized protein LOC134661240 n=1 Tax=Cydia amplana TaxID=1869771 RepID=UPI002FE5E5E0